MESFSSISMQNRDIKDDIMKKPDLGTVLFGIVLIFIGAVFVLDVLRPDISYNGV